MLITQLKSITPTSSRNLPRTAAFLHQATRPTAFKMRIPYTDNPPKFTSDEDKATLERVQARRGEKGLLPLDLALLHAPKIADGWNSLLGAIRTKNSLPPQIREICMLRPALLNEAWFEWRNHLPLYQAAPSYTEAKLKTIADPNPTSQGALTDSEWVVLQYADAMTKTVKVPQEVFDRLKTKGGFSEQEIVEITATCATYNMVSRFLVALDIAEMNEGDKPEEIK